MNQPYQPPTYFPPECPQCGSDKTEPADISEHPLFERDDRRSVIIWDALEEPWMCAECGEQWTRRYYFTHDEEDEDYD